MPAHLRVRSKRQRRQRFQDQRGDAPDIVLLFGPIPGAGAFTVDVLTKQIRVEQCVERELEDRFDFRRRYFPARTFRGDADDRKNGVVALAGLVQRQAADQAHSVGSQADFFEGFAQGGGADSAVDRLGASARKADVR